MDIVDSKTFKSGNSVAVRLPKEIAFAPDTRVTIERNGDVLTIRPRRDSDEDRRLLIEMLDDLARLPKPGAIERRDPILFRDD